MAVQAIIMAGGEGVRLRPMTLTLPKPLVPLLDEPVMGYTLKLLKEHGITDIGATLWYQPHKIRAAFGKGDAYGVKMRYYVEDIPCGTAGSVRLAMDHLKGTFIVMSGDGLTDCDLTRALAFHREKKALATLVLKRVNVPLPYGVVLTDREQRITRFIEKPTWSRVFSDLVNTGIYILEPEVFEHIPAHGEPDFGKDIFPALLQAGLPMYGYETTGYWCDVGDQGAYLEAQLALLRGEVNLPHALPMDATAQVDASATMSGTCFIGKGATVGAGARLTNAILGKGAVAGAGAIVENSCLWQRAAVQNHAQVTHSVLCDGAVVRQEAVLSGDCALGQGAVVGARAQLHPGVKVWPRLRVAAESVVTQAVTTGDVTHTHFTGQGLVCETPSQACIAAAAFAQTIGGKRLALAWDEKGAALASICAGALAAQGVDTLLVGELPLSVLRALTRALRAHGAIYLRGTNMDFLHAKGQYLTSKQLAQVEARVIRQDVPPAFVRSGHISHITGAELFYLSDALPAADPRPLWTPLAVHCEDERLSALALTGLTALGARSVRLLESHSSALEQGEIGFLLSRDGQMLTLLTKSHLPTPEKMQLLTLRAALLSGASYVYAAPGVPQAAALLGEMREEDESAACLLQQTLMEDGLKRMFYIAQALKADTVENLLSALPETHILTREIPCRTKDKGRVLGKLCDTELPHKLGEGILIDHQRGYATIVPDTQRGLVRVVSEARDSEFAKELCDLYLDRIRQIITQETPPSAY